MRARLIRLRGLQAPGPSIRPHDDEMQHIYQSWYAKTSHDLGISSGKGGRALISRGGPVPDPNLTVLVEIDRGTTCGCDTHDFLIETFFGVERLLDIASGKLLPSGNLVAILLRLSSSASKDCG